MWRKEETEAGADGMVAPEERRCGEKRKLKEGDDEGPQANEKQECQGGNSNGRNNNGGNNERLLRRRDTTGVSYLNLGSSFGGTQMVTPPTNLRQSIIHVQNIQNNQGSSSSTPNTFNSILNLSGMSSNQNSRVHTSSIFHPPDEWEVTVTIYDINFKDGTVCGIMEATNVPAMNGSIMTYWEGEIVDGINHDFYTKKWKANKTVDLDHWRKFPGFRELAFGRDDSSESLQERLKASDHVFMRWKEKFFVNVQAHECSLTIAGFYYICFCKTTGIIEGFYFDPNCTPYQQLKIKPIPTRSGFSFPSYDFC